MMHVLEKYNYLIETKLRSVDTAHETCSIMFAVIRFVYFLLKVTGRKKLRDKKIIYSLKSSRCPDHIEHVDSAFIKDAVYYNKYSISIGMVDFVKVIIVLPKSLWQMHIGRDIIKPEIRFYFLVSALLAKQFKKNGVEIILFDSFAYRIEMALLSIFAKECGIKTGYLLDGGFVAESDCIVADVVFVRSRLQENYIKKYGKYFEYKDIKSLYQLLPKDNNIFRERKIIGVFPSGMYARYGIGVNKDSFLIEGERAENKMLEKVKNLALSNSDIDVRIYPHYYGGIEKYSEALNYYKDYILLDNVSLAEEDPDGINVFEDIDLGVTCISTTFFDLLEHGEKCCLIGCYVEMCKSDMLKDFVASTEQDILNFLSMDKRDYFDKFVI